MTDSREARPRWTRLLCLAVVAIATLPGCTEPRDPSAQPPVVAIGTPAAGATFAGGDTVRILATAVDVAGAALPAGQLEWWVVLHHATHTHPFLPPTRGGSASFTIPRQGELASDVFYRVYARAVNDRGRADTAFVDLHPRLMTLSIQTDPSGLDVTIDHQRKATPLVITSVVGMEWPLGVPAGQTLSGIEYEFASWSNGGPETQTVVMPAADLSLLVSMRDAGIANVPPGVTMSAPAEGSVVTADSPTTVTATASDPNGMVALVEFFAGSTKIGADDTAPYSAEWTPSGTGQRLLSARATDTRGAYTVSPAIAV
ncbi:MAG TPA: Ig-like domain-containing protein, partial [Gemmatimonadaceae bacterium]|nr:Ig-like domain-containing protein [Gemmatimonadaceae bacterium]